MGLNITYEATLVQQETAVGAGVHILSLALLGSATGLGLADWLTGLTFAIATLALLSRALHRSQLRSFGPANRVTLDRATLVGGVTTLVVDSFEELVAGDAPALQRAIVKHWDAILAVAEHGLSDGLVENLNAKIRLITRVAFGFKDPSTLIALAMLSLDGHRPHLPGRQT